jgi:hypothetical protein
MVAPLPVISIFLRTCTRSELQIEHFWCFIFVDLRTGFVSAFSLLSSSCFSFAWFMNLKIVHFYAKSLTTTRWVIVLCVSFIVLHLLSPCSFGLISRISSHPAVFFSHNKPANSAFSIINQRNEQAVWLNIYQFIFCFIFASLMRK